MDQPLIDLYHRHAGAGYDRQLRLADFLAKKAGGEEPVYDTATAGLRFGPKLVFEAPLIGTHTTHNNSWLWAWSNRNLRLTVTNRALGDTVRALGHRAGVTAFSMVGMPLDPLLGEELAEHAVHVLGVVLAGELGYDAHYEVPTAGGPSLVLVRDDRLAAAERKPLTRVLGVFPRLLAALPVYDHRAALRGYAETYGIHVTDEAGGLRLTHGKDHLTAAFDARGRLAKLEGTVSAEAPKPPAAKKPAAKKGAKKLAKTVAAKGVKKAAPARKAAKPAAAKKPVKKVVKEAAKPAAKKAGKKR